MFTKEGPVQLVVGDIVCANCRFANDKGPNDFDICIEVTDESDETQHEWVRLEWSENYGRGNFATQKQKEIAIKTLHGIGFEGEDLSTLKAQLSGKTVPGTAKKSKPNNEGHVYINVYLGSGGGNAPKAEDVLSADELRKRLGAASSASSSEAPSPFKAKTTGTNPFQRKQTAAPANDPFGK